MPQERDHVRDDPNHVCHPLLPRKTLRLYPLALGMLYDTQVTLLHLSCTLVRHASVVERDTIASLSREQKSYSYDGGEEPPSGYSDYEHPSSDGHDHSNRTATS